MVTGIDFFEEEKAITGGFWNSRHLVQISLSLEDKVLSCEAMRGDKVGFISSPCLPGRGLWVGSAV